MKILKSFDNSADKWKLSLENKVFIAFDAKSLTSCEFVMKIWERSGSQYSFISVIISINNLETCFYQQFDGSRNRK